MAGELVLGIDIGTTAVKAAVFDGRGRRLHAVAAPVPMRRAPGGVAEQEPGDWLARVQDALDQIGDVGWLAGISAVGITSQCQHAVFVDAEAAPSPRDHLADTARPRRAASTPASAGETASAGGGAHGHRREPRLARMAWMGPTARGLGADRPSSCQGLRSCAPDGALSATPFRTSASWADLATPRPPGPRPPARDRLPPSPLGSIAGRVALAPGLPAVPVSVGIMDVLGSASTAVGLRAEGDAAYLSGTSDVIAAAPRPPRPRPGLRVFPRHGACASMRAHPVRRRLGAWFCDLRAHARAMSPRSSAARRPPRPLFLPSRGERARSGIRRREAPSWGSRPAWAGGAARRFSRAWPVRRLLLEGWTARPAGGPSSPLRRGRLPLRAGTASRRRAGPAPRRAAVPDAGVLGAAALGRGRGGAPARPPAALADLVTHDRTYEPDPPAPRATTTSSPSTAPPTRRCAAEPRAGRARLNRWRSARARLRGAGASEPAPAEAGQGRHR
jgi:xylulokinase